MIPSTQKILVHVGDQMSGAEDHVVYLAANRSGLRRAGYGLYCFDPMATATDSAGQLLPPPGADEAGLAAHAERLAERFAPDRRSGSEGFIVVAPDLAGPVAELMLGSFHANARLRARTLRRALGQPVDRLVLTVQPYDQLFHATWMHLALDRRIEPFVDYAAALADFRGGWHELATVLSEELEVRDMVVETAPLSSPGLLGQLLPDLTLRQPIEPRPRPRVTMGAVTLVQRCQLQGMRLAPGQRDRLVAFHARQPRGEAETGFSPGELVTLRDRYQADLHAMSRIAGVRVSVEPAAAVAAE